MENEELIKSLKKNRKQLKRAIKSLESLGIGAYSNPEAVARLENLVDALLNESSMAKKKESEEANSVDGWEEKIGWKVFYKPIEGNPYKMLCGLGESVDKILFYMTVACD